MLSFTRQIKKWSWIWHIDFVKAFFLLRIHPEHRKYFTFNHVWADGSTSFIEMLSLCMGFIDGPRLYQMFTNIMVYYWRLERNLLVMTYMDDLSGAKDSQLVLTDGVLLDVGRGQAEQEVKWVLEQCCMLGPVINFEKSHLVPQQWVNFLGITLRTYGEIPTKEIKLSRVAKIIKRALALVEKEKASPRKIASVAGAIMSCRAVWGPVVFMRTRHMYAMVARGIESWDLEIDITVGCRDELTWFIIFLDLAKPPIPAETNGASNPQESGLRGI